MILLSLASGPYSRTNARDSRNKDEVVTPTNPTGGSKVGAETKL